MNRYTYKFIWLDPKTQKFVTKYIEAVSLAEAKADFEKTWKVPSDKLSITRR